MVTLEEKTLSFYGVEGDDDARCQITFQRTLRIPDDHQAYPLPPDLGNFPLFHVEDYAERLPADWSAHGGLFFPMYQAEAMWILFSSTYPHAVKIGAGKINAVTGQPWTNSLSDEPQDYLVVPNQPWLDGFSVGEGLVRQFVAMPLGDGFTAEEQLTGQAQTGGLQICVYPMKKDYYDRWQEDPNNANPWDIPAFRRSCAAMICEAEMGLAPGGLTPDEVYRTGRGGGASVPDHFGASKETRETEKTGQRCAAATMADALT